MAKNQDSIKYTFHGYPEPKEGPDTGYLSKTGSNPIVRGIPLAIAGSAAASINLVSSFLWTNAGFKKLREHKELDEFESRYDPTVIPIEKDDNKISSTFDLNSLNKFAEGVNVEKCSVANYHTAFKTGKLTPTVVAKKLLKLTASPSEHRTAFLEIQENLVLDAAAASTKRYKERRPLSILDGVPVAIKDEVDLAGYGKSLGSSQDFSRPDLGTSWCVKRWEEAGAVVIGKLNMHELGLDTTNNNPTKGTPLNPHNPHYYTGGSSGGSAYVVAAGLVPIALGADGGGSIRIPASFCGIYGLKPSHGRVSDLPTPHLASSCGVIGPLASSMADLEISYRIMATPDPNNPASSLFPTPNPPPEGQEQPKILGIYKPWFDSADASVLNICHTAISNYDTAGYKIIDITIPFLPEGQMAHAMTILAEISASIHDLTGLTPANKILISVGKQTPATDFLLAQKLRQRLMQHLAFLFRQHPGLLIVTPTTPLAGWHIAGGAADLKHGVSDGNKSIRNMEYVWLANFSGCPALSVPVGMADPKQGSGKIPVGLMAMAEWGAEESLLEWGRVGEAWASREGEEKVNRPANWVDVLALAPLP